MDKRSLIQLIFEGGCPPYVPWNFSFTIPARDKLLRHFGDVDLETVLDNHFVMLGDGVGFFEEVGPDLFRDGFGVVWDRSIDKDIGNVREPVLTQPSLAGYAFPDPTASRFFESIGPLTRKYPDRFRIFAVGFSLYERAWALRGMENLMLDFIEHPEFVRDLLRTIADWNITHVKRALTYDIDCVFFGDDWGQQRGLQMGPRIWREFIQPEAARMYQVVRDAGRYVMIHSCGDCDELFDDLIEMGVNCFNPFQPEVMDVDTLLQKYRRRLSFFGGLSTQRILPYGTVAEVTHETQRLISLGEGGSYILAPAHDVPGDVPLANMLAFIETARRQRGYDRVG